MARIVATQSETARQLEHRIDLAREIHEGVIQRLFGVSMALDGDGELPAAARERCASETQAALSELRTALQRPLGRAPRATQTTLIAEVERLSHAHPDLGLDARAESSEVPAGARAAGPVGAARGGAQRPQARRPDARGRAGRATPTARSCSRWSTTASAARAAQAGMGLRLAALEALQSGGVVEFGEREPGTWQVRLVVPPARTMPDRDDLAATRASADG